MFKNGLLLILFILNFFLSYKYGGNVSLHSQLENIDRLQNISSVIFGVMGAWIALIYPESLNQILNWNNKLVLANVSAIKRILLPIKCATIVILYVLLFNWISPVLVQLEILKSHKEFALACNFFLVGSSCILLFVAILFSFAPIDHVEAQIFKKSGIRNSLTRKRGMAKENSSDNLDE